MKVFITGSNGLLGQNLLQKCILNSDILPVACSFSPEVHQYAGDYVFEQADLTDYVKANYLLDLYQPDVIIHCAAITQVDDCETEKQKAWEVNALLPGFLAEYCARNNCRLIHLSSDFVFDGLQGMYSEEDIPSPISWYGNTKLEAEKRIAEILPSASIVRTVLLYGVPKSTHRSNILTWVISKLKAKETITVVNDQYRTPTLVDDLSEAIISLLNTDHKGLIHISGVEYLSVIGFALKIADTYKMDASLISPIASNTLNQLGRRPSKTGFVIDRARQTIGYHPHSLKQGLELLRDDVEEYLMPI